MIKTTSLKIIIKSKFGKKKRRAHITQLERELGLSPREPNNEVQLRVTPYDILAEAEHCRSKHEAELIIDQYRNEEYDPLSLKSLYGKDRYRENAYREIERMLSSYCFTDAGTAKDIWDKYQFYQGTVFLHFNHVEIDLINCSELLLNKYRKRLEYAGFKVNVLDR